MRKQSILVLTALVGVVLSFAGAMQAQSVPHYVQVNVPFEFTVGNKLLPAGDYKFACTPDEIELRDARGQVVASAIHHSVRTADTTVSPKLVTMRRVGGAPGAADARTTVVVIDFMAPFGARSAT